MFGLKYSFELSEIKFKSTQFTTATTSFLTITIKEIKRSIKLAQFYFYKITSSARISFARRSLLKRRLQTKPLFLTIIIKKRYKIRTIFTLTKLLYRPEFVLPREAHPQIRSSSPRSERSGHRVSILEPRHEKFSRLHYNKK